MLVLIYWLAIRAYTSLVRTAALFGNAKAKLFVAGRRGLLSHMRDALIMERRPRIWMHCASLGEFEQGRPVLEQLRKDHPNHAIVLTFFSPSGYEVRKNYNGADYIFYLPLDSHRNARLFLDIVQPSLCLFVKYELWYFLLADIARRSIPAILICALFRKEQIFFKWYGILHRRMLQCFSYLFVQDNASARLLQKINVYAVTVAGDTRFDRVIEAVQQQEKLPIATAFSQQNNIIVAGSTWPADEQLLQKALQELPPQWKLILVPHEVHPAHIEEIEKLFGVITIRWSDWKDEAADKRVLIVDRVGLLLQLYAYGNIAWIGGGFGHAGVHNVLEAAVHGIPAAYGPVFHQFIEARELIAAGGAVSIDKPELLLQQISTWTNDTSTYKEAASAAAIYVNTHSGATQKIMHYLSEKNFLKIP